MIISKSSAIPSRYKQTLRWLHGNPETDVPRREKIIFSCLYHLNRFSEALTYGLDLLTTHVDMLAHEDVVSISQTLYKDARTQKTSSDFLIIAGIYADAVFSLDSKELGCQLYTDLVERIRQNPSCIALASSCKILHQAINSQLQSARYDTALAWIGILASLPGLPLEYQFIAQNRYGVAYIALGKF